MLISSKTNIIVDSQIADDIDVYEFIIKSKVSNGFVLDGILFAHSNYCMVDYLTAWSYEEVDGLIVSILSTETEDHIFCPEIAMNIIYEVCRDNHLLNCFVKNQGCRDPLVAISRIIASIAHSGL